MTLSKQGLAPYKERDGLFLERTENAAATRTNAAGTIFVYLLEASNDGARVRSVGPSQSIEAVLMQAHTTYENESESNVGRGTGERRLHFMPYMIICEQGRPLFLLRNWKEQIHLVGQARLRFRRACGSMNAACSTDMPKRSNT